MKLCAYQSGVIIEEQVTTENVKQRQKSLTAQGYTVWIVKSSAPTSSQCLHDECMPSKASQRA